MKGADEKTTESPKYVFPKVIATKPLETEDATTVEEEEFEQIKGEGGYVVTWKTGSSQYGIGMDAVSSVTKDGAKVVITVPSEHLQPLITKLEGSYPGLKLVYVEVQATVEVITERAKELEEKFNDKNFAKKVKKVEGELPKMEEMAKCDNGGDLVDGVEALLTIIGFDPLLDIPPKSDEERLRRELKTCSAQEYLKRVLYPMLHPALERVDRERPEDPVEMLALYLYRSASTSRKRVKELTELKSVKTQLRDEIKKDYDVRGRI